MADGGTRTRRTTKGGTSFLVVRPFAFLINLRASRETGGLDVFFCSIKCTTGGLPTGQCFGRLSDGSRWRTRYSFGSIGAAVCSDDSAWPPRDGQETSCQPRLSGRCVSACDGLVRIDTSWLIRLRRPSGADLDNNLSFLGWNIRRKKNIFLYEIERRRRRERKRDDDNDDGEEGKEKKGRRWHNPLWGWSAHAAEETSRSRPQDRWRFPSRKSMTIKMPRYVWRNVSLEASVGQQAAAGWFRHDRGGPNPETKEPTIIYWRLSSHHDIHHHVDYTQPSFQFYFGPPLQYIYIWSPLFHPVTNSQDQAAAAAVQRRNEFFYLLIHFCRARLHKAFSLFLLFFLFFCFILFHFIFSFSNVFNWTAKIAR